MDKQLRLIAGQIIVESKISKASKLQLLNFIKEDATDTQVKALLMDGKIVQLDEQAEEVVNDRFEFSEAGGRIAQKRKTYLGLIGAFAGYGIPFVIYRKIRGAFDECTKKCGSYELNTARRQHCMIKCKVIKFTRMLQKTKKQNLTVKDRNDQVKLKNKLVKAQALLQKSTQSFKDRGAEI